MKRWLPHIGIATGIGILGYALLSGSSTEDEIHQRLEELEQAVAVEGEPSHLVLRGARLKEEFSELFAKDVQVRIPELGEVTAGRQQLVELATHAPTRYRKVALDLDDLEIRVDEDATSALAVGEAVLTATRPDGSAERDARTVSLRFDQIDGDWTIVTVTVSLQKPTER